jgi:antirestriction protein ArdC
MEVNTMSEHENTAPEKQDVYARVTSQIVNAIEKGVGNWRMPWHTSGRFAFSPINVTSKKPYRGINTVCLWAAAESKGYESGEWGTYKQWQDRGAQVRRGEKSTTVVFWKFANAGDESQDGDEDQPTTSSRLLFTRGYAVFNAAQVDGYNPASTPDTPVIERIAAADAFFAGIGAEIRHAGNRAFYAPDCDYIQMPPFQAFEENVATIRPSRTSMRTGLRDRDAVIVSLGSVSVITHTRLRSWLRNWGQRSCAHISV